MKENLSIRGARILDICASIEDQNAELYHMLADYSTDSQEIQMMWRRTALEEEEHSKQIRMAARLRGDAVHELIIDEAKAGNMLKAIILLVEGVKAKAPSHADSLRLAIQLEEKLAEFHLQFIAHFSDEHCAQMFKFMMSADKDHVKRLKDAYQALNS